MDKSYLEISNNYLITTQAIFKNIISSKNIAFPKIGSKASTWNAYNSGLPAIFLLYHGFETTLKGIIHLYGNGNKKNNHKIKKLLKDIKKINKTENSWTLAEIIKLLCKYIDYNEMSKPLKEVLGINANGSIDEYIQYLKYPFNVDETKKYNHNKIRYSNYHAVKHNNKDNFITIAKEITKDIDTILINSMKIYRKQK